MKNMNFYIRDPMNVVAILSSNGQLKRFHFHCIIYIADRGCCIDNFIYIEFNWIFFIRHFDSIRGNNRRYTSQVLSTTDVYCLYLAAYIVDIVNNVNNVIRSHCQQCMQLKINNTHPSHFHCTASFIYIIIYLLLCNYYESVVITTHIIIHLRRVNEYTYSLHYILSSSFSKLKNIFIYYL
jgi:hypothetical protein